MSAGANALFVGGSAGYKYEAYQDLDMIKEEGWFLEGSLFNITEENGDMIFSFGGSLYFVLGGGVNVDINLSEARRRIEKWLKDSDKC